MRYRALNRTYYLVRKLNTALGITAAAFPASLKADPAAMAIHMGDWAGQTVTFMQTWAWVVTPAALLLIPVLDYIRRLIGNPKVWRIVHDVLDAFREKVIASEPNDEIHQHRVTLFRHATWAFVCRRWPWSGWLLPLERSGHTTRRTNIVFKAPDEADYAEGIAGLTWSRNGMVYVKGLPDLTIDRSDAAVSEYAARSRMPEEVVRKRSPRARSLCGIPVEVNGQLWGVLVVDSRRPEMLEAEVRNHYSLFARFLGKTLEGI